LNVALVPGYGLICKLYGVQSLDQKCWCKPRKDLRGLALWRWWSWHVGIYGSKGMIIFFKGLRPTFRAWKAGFVQDTTLLKYRVRKSDVSSLASWIDNLL
jgi:hypothetical protein